MAEQSTVFRKVSLDRLSSPEQLDQKLTVIAPKAWAALLSLVFLLAAALAWGFLGSISDKVQGSGMMMYSEGIVTLNAHSSGQITGVTVRIGDQVQQGQEIARVSQDDIDRQIEQCLDNIAALEALNAETLDIDIDTVNSEVYGEFAGIAGQVRTARVQYEAQGAEATKSQQDIANQQALQQQQVSSLERQIAVLEEQIVQYEELLDHQREVELENAADQDNQRASQSAGAFVTDDNGNYYRRRYRAERQLTVQDQVGNAYIIFSDYHDDDDEIYPVFYMDNTGNEIFNENGDFYLPNYYGSVYDSYDYVDLPSRSARKRVYYDSRSGYRYIDLTGREFTSVSNSEDFPSALEQAETRPDYDGNLASMQSQLESLKLQLIEAQMQGAQLASTFTNYLWGGYNQTGEQITSLMEQFAELKQVKRQDYLKQLAELQTELAENSVITAGFSGTVSALNIKTYDFVQPGTIVATVIREEDGQDTPSNVVTLYVAMDKGTLVKEGMEVNISPASTNQEEHGYIIGRVNSVSSYAVTSDHMMQSLQNQALVNMFSGQSAVLELEVELLLNSETVSGYQWSTPKGAPISIEPGTICSGEIKVASKRPIEMVVPFIKRLFSGAVSEEA